VNVIQCVDPEAIAAEFVKVLFCEYCGSQFEYHMQDVWWTRPYEPNGWTEYYIACPCCERSQSPVFVFDTQAQRHAYQTLYLESNHYAETEEEAPMLIEVTFQPYKPWYKFW
jgi:hypothetical protein